MPSDDLEVRSFATTEQLWQMLETGIAHGWSESSRRRGDEHSYLQKFTPRRTRGTTSQRNTDIADRLEREGRMTPAGRRALGR